MNDMRAVIAPKSDQINADDLLAGPMTITITEVNIRPGQEQPVAVRFEGDGGKPWKPCKSMARVLVHCWGPDAKHYVGRSVTIYCDPKVKWGGMEVGGIRISHLSHIERQAAMALTETKGKRKIHTVHPLNIASPQQPRRTARDLLAAIKARIDAGDALEAIEAMEEVSLIRSKAPDAAKAELGVLLAAVVDAEAAP